MPDSTSHSVRRDGRCPSCGLSPYERGIGDADISRIVAERNRLVEQYEDVKRERDGLTGRNQFLSTEVLRLDVIVQSFQEQQEVLRFDRDAWKETAEERQRLVAVVEAHGRELQEQLEAAQKAQHVQNLEWAISLAESDPLYAEVFRPYFQKIVDALASNPATGSGGNRDADKRGPFGVTPSPDPVSSPASSPAGEGVGPLGIADHRLASPAEGS